MEKATMAEGIMAFLGILAIGFGPIICLALEYPEDFKDTLREEKEKFKSLFSKK